MSDSEQQVYRPDLWSAVSELFVGLDRLQIGSVGPYLSERSERLLSGWRKGSIGAVAIVSNWHPDLVGDGQAMAIHIPTIDDAQLTVAREHGFDDWAAVQAAGPRLFDLSFETAVEHLLAGRADELRRLVSDRSDVVENRSPFEHRATLLHYIAANGVETERQVTPLNAPEMIELLREAGADVAAVMNVYGGGFTALELTETSAHPHDAGVLRRWCWPSVHSASAQFITLAPSSQR